uniref:Uncharacterized protein n=1 Tax=Anguilla anguilla TaxID=7936 RepID=A0A0E9XKA8_ANGAN
MITCVHQSAQNLTTNFLQASKNSTH